MHTRSTSVPTLTIALYLVFFLFFASTTLALPKPQTAGILDTPSSPRPGGKPFTPLPDTGPGDHVIVTGLDVGAIK